MDIVIEKDDDLVILCPAGRLDDAGARQFQSAMTQLLQEGRRWVVVDLAQAESIGGAIVRALRTYTKTLRVPEGGLVLCSMSEEVGRGFQVAGPELTRPLAITRSREEAVQKLRAMQTLKRIATEAAVLLAKADKRVALARGRA